jgi:peptide chain release factor subunit 1
VSISDPGVVNINRMAEQPQESSDKNVEIWKIKKLIKSLEAARGNGTSMISLIIPPRDQVPRIAKMLADEYGTASNIKSRVNRLSVLSAITSVQARLKLYNKGLFDELIEKKIFKIFF